MISIFVAAWTVDSCLQDLLGNLSVIKTIPGIPDFEVVAAIDLEDGAAQDALAALGPFSFPVRAVAARRKSGSGAALKLALLRITGDRLFFLPVVLEATSTLLRQCLLHHDDAEVILGFPINIEARHPIRNIGTLLFRMLYLFSFGAAVNCVNSMGIYPTAVLSRLGLKGNHFSILAELNTRILRTGCTYCEVPFYTFTDRRPWRSISVRDIFDLLRSYTAMLVEFRILGRWTPPGPASLRRPMRIDGSSKAGSDLKAAQSKKLSFVIPAFNEANNIGPTINMVREVCARFPWIPYEVIIVNDGSTDATGAAGEELSRQFPGIVRIVHNAGNQGIGKSIQNGVAAAAGDRFTFLPGDNQASPFLVSALLRFDGEADVVFSYPSNLGARGMLRNLVSQFYILVFMALCGSCLNYVNAVGIYPIDLIRQMRLRGKRFSFVAELNVKIIRAGCSFVEVPGHANSEAVTNHRIWRTINPRNATEAIGGLGRLMWELTVARRQFFRHQPRRRLVDLSAGRPPLLQAAASTRSAGHAAPFESFPDAASR
jgi:hypothetical protein